MYGYLFCALTGTFFGAAIWWLGLGWAVFCAWLFGQLCELWVDAQGCYDMCEDYYL